MSHRALLRAVPTALLLVALSGCGYQLRSAARTLPPEVSPVHIDGFALHSRERRQLVRILAEAGAAIAETPEQAGSVLKIDEHRSTIHVLSVDRNTRAQEYELRESIRFSFQALRSGRKIATQQLRARRIFNQERSKATREEAEQREEMRADLFRRLVSRLQAQL